MWNKVSEKKLPYGEEVIVFNEKWIDKDFNPNGTRVGFLRDDGFISAEWDDGWDEYVTYYGEGYDYDEGDDYDGVPANVLDELHMKFAKPSMPTHWMKMPTHP